MKADLERRVHELLDAGRDPAEDPQVRSAIEGDREARAEVAALSKLEGWLRDWEVGVPEEDLEPIAQRIEQRLDEPVGSFDATAAPVFDDPDAKVRPLGERGGAVRSGEYSLDALAGAVEAPAPAQMTGPSPAVRLSAPARPEPKRKTPIAPWIAAAAVVALGVIVSVSTLQTADEPAAVASEAAPAAQAFPATPEPTSAASYADEEMAEAEEPMEEEVAAEAAADRAPSAPTGGGAGPAEGAGEDDRVRVATRRNRAAPASMSATASPMASAGYGGALQDTVRGTGGTAPEQAREAVERSRAAVRACLGAGSDSAVVMVRFRDGTVRDARVVRPSANDATNECVAGALRRARVRPEGDQTRRTLYYRWGSPAAAIGN